VAGLSIVNGPSVDTVGEGFFEIGDGGSADSDLNKLSFVDKYLEIVSTSLCEYFCAHGGLEAITLS
jgi:hypothetical protein